MFASSLQERAVEQVAEAWTVSSRRGTSQLKRRRANMPAVLISLGPEGLGGATASRRSVKRGHPPLVVRDAEAGRNAERFLVASIATVLAIRAFLAATGYPQLGGRYLHIAHVLWGGLALASALLLLLVSIGRRVRPVAAILGGVGFGFFIDELGKFLTRDNDYFYQPAIALIYFVFVGLFLWVRVALARRALTVDERIANALTLMKDMAIEDLDEDEKGQAAALLEGCDPRDPRVALVRGFLDRLSAAPAPPPGLFARFRHWLVPRLDRVVRTRGFGWVLSALFAFQAVIAFGLAVATARNLWTPRIEPSETHLDISFASWGEILSSIVSAVIVTIGVMTLWRSRVRAYRMFRRSVRVAILVTQFFVFYDAQLSGLVGLASNIMLLGILDYLIAHEDALAASKPATAATPARPAPA
jgi:hypothetical protein